MIGLLMGLGLGKREAQLVGYVAVPALIAGALWLGLWWYGNSRYEAGVAASDAKWVEAGERLEEQAAAAATAASNASAARVAANNKRVAEEKERLDAAEASGSSPLDVLFGG